MVCNGLSRGGQANGKISRIFESARNPGDRTKGIERINMLRSLERTFDLFMAHHFTTGLPPDNNVTENVIKQLNKKLRLMEGFESIESAERYARLLVGCYRFKRFTDSHHNGNNGKAPLELAGVDLGGRDWLSFLLNR